MKFLTIFLILCGFPTAFVSVFGEIEVTDKEKIVKLLEDIKNISNETLMSFASSLFVNSLDVECILTQYEKHNLTDKIISTIDIKSDYPEDLFHNIIFFDVVASCYNSFHVFLAFSFENLMTLKILVDGFIDNPAMEMHKNSLICINNLTIENDLWDESIYPLNSQLEVRSAMSCDELLGIWLFANMAIEGVIGGAFNRQCVFPILKEAEILALKTAMLLQVNLTNDQKDLEKNNFIDKIHKICDDILVCAAQPPEKLKNPLDDLIKSFFGGNINNNSELKQLNDE